MVKVTGLVSRSTLTLLLMPRKVILCVPQMATIFILDNDLDNVNQHGIRVKGRLPSIVKATMKVAAGTS